MANICGNSVVISGPEVLLKELRQKLADQDPDFIKSVFDHGETTDHADIAYGLETDLTEIREGSGSISLFITSKWAPPTDDFAKLAAAYPGVTIEVSYEESGNQCFGNLKYADGVCVMDQGQDAEEWYSENSEDYNDLVEHIRTCPYKKFYNDYITNAEKLRNEDPVFAQYGYLMDKHILARVKTVDLPRLIDYDWNSDEVREAYKARLAAGK